MIITLMERLKKSLTFYREMIGHADQSPQTFTFIFILLVITMFFACLHTLSVKSVTLQGSDINLPKTTAAYFFPEYYYSYLHTLNKEFSRLKGAKIYTEPTLYPFLKESHINDLDKIQLNDPPQYFLQYLDNFYDPKNNKNIHKSLESTFYFQGDRVQIFKIDKVDKAVDAQD